MYNVEGCHQRCVEPPREPMPLAADWLHLAAITRRQLHRWPETRLLMLKIGQTERKNEPKRSKHRPPDRPTKMCLVYNPENVQ